MKTGAAYAQQFLRRSHVLSVIRHWAQNGTQLTNVVADLAGGDKWSLTVVVQRGRPTWGLVETTTDP